MTIATTKSLPVYVTDPLTPSVVASIDSYTTRVTLPVDPKRPAWVTIEGVWGDVEDYGPSPSIIELKAYAGRADGKGQSRRSSAHTLTRDTSFALPAETDTVNLAVTLAVPGMDLTLRLFQPAAKDSPVRPPVPPVIPTAAVRPAIPAPPAASTALSVELNNTTASPPPFRRPRGQRGGRNRSPYARLSPSSVTPPNAAAHR